MRKVPGPRLALAAGTVGLLLAAGCSGPSGRAAPTTRPGTSTSTTAARPTTTAAPPATSTTRPPAPTTTAAPPTTVAGRLFGRVWGRLPTGSKVVALTFDAGANADGLPSILDTLQRTGTPATFFLTGAFTKNFPALAARVAQLGYRVGDHTVDHPHLPALSDAAVRAEVLDAATTIRSVTIADPAPLFRFPYGDSDARTLGILNGLGYVAVGWTVDTLGWEGTSGGQSASSVLARVTAGLGPGEIVLMHVGSNPDDHSTLDADALPSVIAALGAAGYSPVTMGFLLGA